MFSKEQQPQLKKRTSRSFIGLDLGLIMNHFRRLTGENEAIWINHRQSLNKSSTKPTMKTLVILSLLAGLFVPTVSQAGDGTPKEQAIRLYDQIRSEKRDSALQDFFSGSLVEKQMGVQVKALDTQARSTWELVGKPTAIEIIDQQELCDSLTRIRWLTKHQDDKPLFWVAVFYKRHGKWEPLSVFFDDTPERILNGNPGNVEPVGPANGSQSIRSETDSTPPAAGSRR